jgi:hypothetical protein
MLVEQQWPDVPVTSKAAAPDKIVTAIACLLKNAIELARRFLARGLYEVDQVAAGIFKQDGGDRTHSLWLAAEVDPKSFESLELCANVFRHEHSGWNSCGKQRFLIRLCRRKTRGLEKQFNPLRSLRRRHSQPTILAHRYVFAFRETKNGRVEAKSNTLVLDHDAGDADLHRGLAVFVSLRTRLGRGHGLGHGTAPA